MRLRTPRFWIAAASVAIVLSLAIVDLGSKSPGPLAEVHGREGDLSGTGSCKACHGGWFSGMTESCLECHAPIAAQMREGAGLHGHLSAPKASQCGTCHSEHHGAEFAIVNRQSFAQAGLKGPEGFDHSFLGYGLEGKHLEIACVDCHKGSDVAVLPKGGKRFAGLRQDCATCHEDPHEGRMSVSCATCHLQTDWQKVVSIGHERKLPLVGGHEGISCRDCHAKEGPSALETQAPKTPRDCASCHESPHRADFTGAFATAVGKRAGESCVSCHEAEHKSFHEPGIEMTPEEHSLTGFEVDLPHDKVACAKCHEPGGETFAVRYPGRTQEKCDSCHKDPHEGQFGDATCLSCHEPTRFKPSTFGTERHAGTKLPLDGRHLEAKCDACHRTERIQVFRATPSTCEGCHADAHGGYFAKFGQPACNVCHLTTDFARTKPFDHVRYTPFPVRGAHEQEECAACHRPREAPDERGRSFGRIEGFLGCESCHNDPHQGEFDRPPRPLNIDRKTGCARCHVDTSFRVFPDGFDHGQWTGYPLADGHAKADCSACHKPLRKADESGRTWGRARGTGCADCHNEPHAGQFRVNGVTDCQECHRSAMSFSTLVFRHDVDSRFPLDEQHEKVSCASCHKAPRAGEPVRYKPLRMQCVDCHPGQNDPLRRPRGK